MCAFAPFPASIDSFSEMSDKDIVKSEEEDGCDHVVPLHVARSSEDNQYQQSVSDKEGTDEPREEVIVKRPLSEPASDVTVGSNELQEGGNEEENRTDKQCFAELLLLVFLFSPEALHHPQ